MSAQQKPIRVFLVDEYPLSRIGWRAVLKADSEIKVLGEATLGTQALPLIEHLKPDVVLLSMQLGDINCLEMAETIKQSSRPDTRLVLLTDSEQELELLAALSVKADGYCAKALESRLLPSLVKTIHHGGIWFDSRTANAILDIFNTRVPPDHGKTQAHLTPEEITFLQKLNGHKETACDSFPDWRSCNGYTHQILDRLTQDERVMRAARIVRKVYGPKHRQAIALQEAGKEPGHPP